jgi:propanol-preferring alcohol dehydrogenase
MKAAVLRALGSPITIEDVPAPECGPGEITLKVTASGLCHSDVHLAGGDWDLLKRITKIPLILGHEVIGTVVDRGEDVTLPIGSRAGIPWIHWTCGKCEFCREGRETLCGEQKITGCTVDGGHAQYIKAPVSHAARIPPSLTDAEAAPLLCAGLTVYKAMKAAGVTEGQRLAIFGIGGLGHLAVQIARAMDVTVIAVDVAPEKLEFAKSLGADSCINAAAEQVHKAIRSQGGAHVAMVTSASSAAYETALRSLRKGGTLAVVGMAPEPFPVSAVSLISGEIRIVGSAVGTRQDLVELFELVERYPIRCHVETRPLAAINDAFEELRNGKVLGRIVLEP